MVEIFMPKAGMDMKEGRLIRWLKEVGDPVEKDEAIMEIETDKITMEAEAAQSGILLSKVVEEDAVVPVLTVLGYIGQKDEKVPDKILPPKKVEAQKEENTIKVSQEVNQKVNHKVPATPLAKKIAAANHVDLASVKGSKQNGKISKIDVIRFIEEKTALENTVLDSTKDMNQEVDKKADIIKVEQTGPENNMLRTLENRQPLRGIRKVVGERMFASYSQVPTVMQSMKVDLTKLFLFRSQLNECREHKFSINDFILKATAIAVKEMPHVRTMVVDGELLTYKEANIGFAVAVDEGLYVPVIHNADTLSLSQISAKAKELAEKSRNGTIRPDEYSGGTFSISNMGMYDVYTFNPIINQPESGILGITGVEEVLALEGDKVVVHKVAVLCMSYDHRVMDGVGSAKLKKRVKELLENPMEILL